MAFRFWRRIKVAPGVTVNLSKSGGSLSFGPRGAKFTIGRRGKRATLGIPGTGLFYTTTLPGKRSDGAASTSSSKPALRAESQAQRLTLGFFKRLITPDDEQALAAGCRQLVLGNEDKALEQLRKAAHLADGAYLAGMLALKKERLDDAEGYLNLALARSGQLGRHFSRYGISASISLPITDELAAHVEANMRGVLLALVEVYQRQKRWRDALDCLQRLLKLAPDDVVVKLSLAELLFELRPGERRICQRILRLAKDISNDSPIHAALLLYKARALRRLNLPEAAGKVLTEALRRKKDRPAELLLAMRYERALVYAELGKARLARSELEKLYAEAPDYEDVAVRLGLR